MTSVRSAKGPPLKKGPPESSQATQSPGRRAPAWGQNRNTSSPGPGYSTNAANRSPANGFPPLGAQATAKPTLTPNAWGSTEDKQQLLAGLAGSINQIITVSLRTNTRYEGTLTFVSPSPSDDASLTLKNAKDLSSPNAPPKDTMKIPASNVLSFSPGSTGSGSMTKVNDSFRTDTEISRNGPAKRERELQAWKPEGPEATSSNGTDFPRGDDATFGPGASTGGQWDQFAANERLFGVRTHFDEDEYTTRLDRNAKDFKERERRAEQLAAEITGSATNNPHILEERGVVDDSGVNEEDRYGAVVRGANAYVPPGARRQTSASDVPAATKQSDKEQPKTEGTTVVPKVSINAPDGTEKSVPRTGAAPAGASSKQPADALPAFRDFVTNEKQRLTQKKQALVKNEMDKRVAELIKFGNSFKLNKPIPDDLLSIVAKDEDKQRQIREKSEQDAQSAKARAIGVSASVLNAAAPAQKTGLASPKAADAARKPSVPPVSAKPSIPGSKSSGLVGTSPNPATSPASAAKPANGNGKIEPSKTMPRISMVIPAIPPFKGKKSQPSDGKASSTVASQPMSPTTQQRLNVNASAFRPNPKAAAFTPTGSSSPQTQAQMVSPKPASASASPTPNPFFGNVNLKKSLPVNVKEDFNPFKSHAKVTDAKSVGPQWAYSGKRYMSTFPAPPTVTAPAPHPQASPHMAAHGPPPPPPPSYDEDAAAQAQAAASRGYTLYTYAPYYPGQHPQHLMPGMAGVPPNAFIPAPYMQPMPYPPNMHPPNGQPMYAPPHMGQMPPPQQYMPPPPPGAYPAPPPNSGGPRPSMPPTPIPTHAHPYYHQSPQRMPLPFTVSPSPDPKYTLMTPVLTVQHAIPYQMMMPPPGGGPNGPPHPYEAGPPPPVPMGGVGHA